MPVKIPTFASYKKNKDKRIEEKTIESIFYLAHNGISANVDFVDMPMVIHNEGDEKMMRKIVKKFNDKGWKLKFVAERSMDAMPPSGPLQWKELLCRLYLKDIPKEVVVLKHIHAGTDTLQ